MSTPDLILTCLKELRVADRAILSALIPREAHDIRQSLYRLHRHRGLIEAVDKRLPGLHGKVPFAYFLTEKGAEVVSAPWDHNFFEAVRFSTVPKLMERLHKATVHAALAKGDAAGLFRLTDFREEVMIEAAGERARCDCLYTLNDTYTVAVEIDSGSERGRSGDGERKSLEKKLYRYGVIDNSGELEPFRVLFVVTPNLLLDDQQQRHANVLKLMDESGKPGNHRADFWQVTHLSNFTRAIADESELHKGVIHVPRLGRALSIAPPRGTLEEARRVPA